MIHPFAGKYSMCVNWLLSWQTCSRRHYLYPPLITLVGDGSAFASAPSLSAILVLQLADVLALRLTNKKKSIIATHVGEGSAFAPAPSISVLSEANFAHLLQHLSVVNICW